MFDVICPRHGHRVLLFGSQIRLENTPQGIEVHWTCSCGAEGVERVGALAPHAVRPAPAGSTVDDPVAPTPPPAAPVGTAA